VNKIIERKIQINQQFKQANLLNTYETIKRQMDQKKEFKQQDLDFHEDEKNQIRQFALENF